MRFPFADTIAVAHRGAHGPERPENSLAAIERAVAVGARGIEFDVCSLADGTLVVHHNAWLLSEDDKRVEITALRSGDALARALPRVEPYLELLAGADALVLFDWKAGDSERAAVLSLRAHGLLERTILCSTDGHALARARASEPTLATGLSVDARIDAPALDRMLATSGATSAMLSRRCVRDEFAEMLRRTRRGLFIWNFSGHDDLTPFLSFRPDGVATDAIEESLRLPEPLDLIEPRP
jgi:glycerophosphoryl diester phosphodiesterase